jgi:hypothetical protein
MTLTRKKFVQWLRGQNPGRRFKRNSGCSCPIAEWIKEAFGEKVDNVSPWAVAVSCLSGGFVLPGWAQLFIRTVDYGTPAEETITAAQCLELLGEKP